MLAFGVNNGAGAMCGRFVQKDLAALAAAFDARLRHDLAPRHLAPAFNIAPTRDAGVIGRNAAGDLSLTAMRWGLVPFFAADASGGGKLFNARSETAAEKPSFREAFRRRRAIVPADGFYEWKPDATPRQPWFIARVDGEPLAMAGLWEIWRDPADGNRPLFTFTILTTDAGPDITHLHHRQPVLLADGAARRSWLDGGDDAALLRPSPAGTLTARPVNPLVNGARAEGPTLLDPAPPPAEPVGMLL